MTNEVIDKNLLIAKKIKKLGIASLIIHIITIVAFIAWLVVLAVAMTNFGLDNNVEVLSNTQVGLIIFIGILGVIYFLCNLIFGIIVIIKIANTNWVNENLNQTKLVFWILSLVFIMMILVNPILWIVWGNKVKGSYSSKEQLPG